MNEGLEAEDLEDAAIPLSSSSTGWLHTVSLVPGDPFSADEELAELSVLVEFDEGAVPGEAGGLNDVLFDRVSVLLEGAAEGLEVGDVLKVSVGDNAYADFPDLVDEACEGPSPLLHPAFATGDVYYVCADDDQLHVTLGNAARDPTEPVEIVFQGDPSIGAVETGFPTTVADEHDVTVELFKSGHGLDHVGSVPAQGGLPEPVYGDHELSYVVELGAIDVLEFQTDQQDLEQTAGETAAVTYQVNALDRFGNEVPVDSATDVDWDVDSEDAGEFAANVFTPSDDAGEYTITATHTESGVSGSTGFTIIAGPVDSIAIIPADESQVAGATEPVTYSVDAEDEFGNGVDVDSATEVEWDVDSGDAGSFDANVFTPLDNAGDYTITATHTESGASDSTSFTITSGTVDRIEIQPRDVEQTAGETAPITYEIDAWDASDNEVEVDSALDVDWSVDLDEAGSFEDNVFTPSDLAGTYTITATHIGSGESDSTSFTVATGTLDRIEITPADVDQIAGDTAPITYEVDAWDAFDNEVEVDSSSDIEWGVDSEDAGSFDANVFTPLDNAGEYTITAIHTESGASDSTSFTVATGTVNRIEITPADVNQIAGDTAPITYEVDAWDAFDNEVEVDSSSDIEWGVDSENAGSFDANVFTPLDNAGEYTITATHTENGAGDSTNFTILTGPAHEIKLTEPVDENVQVQVGKTVPVVVKVIDGSENPVEGHNVDFTVDSQPPGAVAALDPETNATAGNGTAGTTVTVGIVAGTYVIHAVATDENGDPLTGSPVVLTIDVIADQPDLFVVDCPADVGAGVEFTCSIEAQDEQGNQVTVYEGNVDINTTAGTINGHEPQHPATVQFTETDEGLKTINLTLFKAEEGVNVTAQDQDDPSVEGVSDGIDVEAAILLEDQFAIACDGPVVAGGTTDCQVETAKDEFGNDVSVDPSWSAEGGAFSPTQGTSTTWFAPTTTDTYTITATEEREDAGPAEATTDVEVTPGSATTITFVEGQQFSDEIDLDADDPVDTATAVVEDNNGNPVPGFDIYWFLTPGDNNEIPEGDENNHGDPVGLSTGSSTTDADGQTSVVLTGSTVAGDTYRIKAQDDPDDPGLTRNSGKWSVVPGSLFEYGLACVGGEPCPAEAGTGESFDVEALDQSGNVIHDYDETESITTSGPTPSPDGTEPVCDDQLVFSTGEAVLNCTFYNAEAFTLEVENGASGAIDVNVGPAGAHALIWNSEIDTVDAGTCTPYELEIQDAYGNLQPNGSFHVSLDAALTSEEGDNGTLYRSPCEDPAQEILIGDGYSARTLYYQNLETSEIELQATDVDNGLEAGTYDVTVQPAVAEKFEIECTSGCDDGEVTAGTTFDLELSAFDAHGNLVASGDHAYEGSKDILFSGPNTADGGQKPECGGVELEEDVGSTVILAFSAGASGVSCTFYKAEEVDLETQDENTEPDWLTGTIALNVVPGPLDDLSIAPAKEEDDVRLARPLSGNQVHEEAAVATALDAFKNPIAGVALDWFLADNVENEGAEVEVDDHDPETGEDGQASVNLSVPHDAAFGDTYRVLVETNGGSIDALSAKFIVFWQAVAEGGSIQEGVDTAESGYGVLVESGTYEEDVVIGKDLTLAGARAGVDARGREGDESLVNGSIYATSDASEVTIDGFKVVVTEVNPFSNTAIIADSQSPTVRNNIVKGIDSTGPFTRSGIVDLDGVKTATIAQNDVELWPASSGQNGIRVGLSADADRLDILDNAVSNADGGAVGIMNLDDADVTATISGNHLFDSKDGLWTAGPGFGPMLNGTFQMESNTFENNTDAHVRDLGEVFDLDVVLENNTFPEGAFVNDNLIES